MLELGNRKLNGPLSYNFCTAQVFAGRYLISLSPLTSVCLWLVASFCCQGEREVRGPIWVLSIYVRSGLSFLRIQVCFGFDEDCLLCLRKTLVFGLEPVGRLSELSTHGSFGALLAMWSMMFLQVFFWRRHEQFHRKRLVWAIRARIPYCHFLSKRGNWGTETGEVYL